MNPRTLITALILSAAILFVAYESISHAGTNAKAPDIQWPQSPCNLHNRMNIAVIDGLMFECVCSRLQVNYECSWWIVAGVTSANRRPIKRRHSPRATRIYTHPSVVA